jgi:hypothetical protein
MKQKIINILLMSPALLFMACSSDDVSTSDNIDGRNLTTNGVPIEIVPNVIEPVTRTDFDLGTSISDGEIVHVWVDDPNAATTAEYLRYSSYHYKAQSYQALGSETKSHVLTYNGANATPTFPQSGLINVYAYHWSDVQDENLILARGASRSVTHRTQYSQVQQTDYAKSDLLWGKVEGAIASRGVTIPFRHKLSNIVVRFDNEENLNLLNTITKIKINGVYRTATMTYSRDTVILTNYTDKGSIEIAHDFGKGRLNEGIILPQTVTSGEFIELSTDDGRTFVYSLVDYEFKPGHQYTFYIKVNTKGFEITCPQITDWGHSASNDEDANATMPDVPVNNN